MIFEFNNGIEFACLFYEQHAAANVYFCRCFVSDLGTANCLATFAYEISGKICQMIFTEFIKLNYNYETC